MNKKQLVGKYMRIQEGDSILADIEKFNKIADENEFSTDWSLYEIEDLSLKSPFKGKWMSKDGDINSDIRVKLPNRKLTWLELWKYADMLFEIIGDSEHMFIESFEVKEINGKRELQVFFGS
jgi:hypothetical protein